MGAVVALLAAGVAAAAETFLRGAVYTEGPATAVTVRVWAMGDRVVVDSALLASPLAEASVAPGSAFSLRLPGASPVRVEVSAPNYVSVCLDVLFPEQAMLPPARLPQGERLEVVLRRGDKPAGEAPLGAAAVTDEEGRAHLPLVGGQKEMGAFGRQLVLWAPGFQVQGVGVTEGSGPLEVALKPSGTLAVRVTDSAARPRAGVSVWAWVPEGVPAFMVGGGLPSEPPQRRWRPEGLSDGTGAAVLAGLPAGKVKASARAAGFPEAVSNPVELAAG